MTGILLIGASGLVGSHIIAQAENRQLGVLVRRPIDGQSPNIREYLCDDGNDWPKRIAAIKPQQLVCCIGTTMKKAGGQVAFRAVDQHLVLACAQHAARSGARHMIVLTSVGASDRVDNIYLNAKGVVERELGKMGFDRLDIIRPGLLLGQRTESRAAEAVGQALAPIFNPMLMGPFRKFRAIPAATVARSIWRLTGISESGQFIHENEAINALAG
jgi:uncharacterized protein YbjT (DUF2867 family)